MLTVVVVASVIVGVLLSLVFDLPDQVATIGVAVLLTIGVVVGWRARRRDRT